MAGLVMRQDMAMIHGMKGGIELGAPKTLLDRLPAGTVSRARRLLPNWFINFLFRQYPAYRKSVKMIHRNIVELAKRCWPQLVVLDGFVCIDITNLAKPSDKILDIKTKCLYDPEKLLSSYQ
jgi:hypothetical protein